MTRFTRLAFLWLCTAIAVALNAAEPHGAPDGSGDVFARAQAGLDRAVREGRIAGGVHLVVRDGKTLFSETTGFGDIEERTSFTADSILRVYASTQFAVVPEEKLFQIFALQQLPYTEELAKQQFGIVYAGLPARAASPGAAAEFAPPARSPASSTVGASTGAGATPGYETVTNISYRTGSDLTDYERERCRLDIYYPTDRTAFATVVWFHGGGLTGGNRSLPETLKGKGIAVVAAGYRLSPHVKSPAYVEDAAAAVAWTFRNIERYGGSTNRVFVSGHSAGGYLTSMVGLDRRWLAAQGLEANRIAGLIPLSPQAITHFTIRAERGISDKQPIVDDMAPLYHVRQDAPPILLVTGDREKELLGRYEENAYFWRMFKVVGHPDAELIELKGYNHGQMDEPAYPLLLRFIEKHSPAPADSPVESAHWNQFRGPNGQGVAPNGRIPVHFGPETNVSWKLAIPPGHSSPVIWDNHLFLTATETDKPQALLTLAIDRRNSRVRCSKRVGPRP